MDSTRSRKPRGIHTEEKPESWQEEVKDDAEVIGEVEKVIIKETTEPLELKQHEEKVTEDLVIDESACLEPHNAGKKKKMGSTRSRTPQGIHTEEKPESWQEEVKDDAEVIGEVEKVIIKETTVPLELKQHEEKVTDDLMIEESTCLEPHNAGKRKKMGSTRSRKPRGIHTEEKPESWQEEVKDDAEVIEEVEKVIIKETTVPLELKQHEEKVTDDLMIEESACLESHNAGRRKKMGSTRSRKPRGIHTEEKQESWQDEVKEDTEAIGEVENVIIEESTEPLELKKHEEKVTEDLVIDLPSVQSFVSQEETACLEPHNAGRRKKMGSTRSRTPGGIHRVERPESWQEEVKEDTEAIGEVENVTIEETTGSLELKQHEEKVTEDLVIDPPSVQRFVGPEETANVEPHPAERRRKMGSTRSRTPQGRQREERPEESQEVEHKENPEVIGQIGEVMRAELTEPVELKENVGKVTEYQVRDKTETLAVEDCNITAEEKCPNYTNVSESKAIGKRRKMGSTRQTRGFHTEEGKREVEKKVFHEEVKWENIRDPEVIVISDKIPKDYRAEAVSLEDQQKRPIAETQDVDTNIGSSGERAEHVTPALQPGQANKMSQEKDGHIYTSPVTKAMNQPRGTLGSSGSRSNPYHVVTVGNSNVGKTSFIKFFQSGEFSMDYAATIGIDTCIQSVKVDGSPVTLQIWDTAGQERYHSITRQVFHKAQGLLLIYDITSSQSFYDIRYWVNCIQEGAPSDAVILLLGNKTDCAEAERKVQTNEGKNLAKEHNMLFMECSAATGENVILSMEALARKIKQLGVETRQEEESLMLHKEPPRKKLSCC
ncbi:hypothetical protein UPYG_G00166780 [Umbra pygmaea]|uniref:Uncharacterized protein n=1 Tax=Umbra pygmaea TaxID=75934 RepID=A0ABD0X4Q2_UMBPY